MLARKKAEECFSEFIKENFLDTVLNDENIKEVIENIDKEHISKEMYAFYKYVIYMYKTDYELFKVIQKFCMGYIVANALSLDNISSSNIIFKNKKIFFDTNFILRLLGLEGEFYQNSYIGILNLLLVVVVGDYYFFFCGKSGRPSLAIFSAGVFMPSLTHLEITETIAELQKELR